MSDMGASPKGQIISVMVWEGFATYMQPVVQHSAAIAPVYISAGQCPILPPQFSDHDTRRPNPCLLDAFAGPVSGGS
jgi:hypothetical protein